MTTTTDPCSPDTTPDIVPIDTSARRFRANVLANLVYFVFNAGLQLWFTRYLIDNLGVATYGLVPLATNMTNYMAILTVALSGSVGRFLTIDLARGDVETANKTFNTSLFATIALAMALMPVVGALSWFSPHILNIPEGEENGTRFLLLCTGFAFLLNTVGSNFACSTFAKNRFDYQCAVNVLGQVVQVGVAVGLFSVLGAKLWQVGIGIAAMSVMRQAGYQITWRKLTPELRIRPRSFDRTRLREVLGMGGWLTVNQAGAVLFLQVDLLVANTVVGAEAAGLYAPVLQMSSVLRALATVVSSVFTPVVLAAYARADPDFVAHMTNRASKLLGLALAIPTGLACGLSQPLLVAWLGVRFESVSILVWLLVGPLALTFCVRPVSAVNIALNKVMYPGLVQIGLGAVNLGLSIWLAGPMGWGLVGVAAGSTLTLIAKNSVFMPLYGAAVLGRPWHTFLNAMLAPLAATAILAGAAWGIANAIGLASLPAIACVATLATVVYVPLAYRLVLNAAERSMMRRLVGYRS